jgi:predicted nucleic acid-binding Zn finger protein
MSKDLERVQSMVSEKRVKLHIFEPSQRKIWTVVGKGEEYWIDPDCNYCSCPGFYFGKLNDKITCYHLESAHLARKENQVEDIVFSDDEFSDFLSALIADL